jgi:DNA mismatch repair protein MutL
MSSEPSSSRIALLPDDLANQIAAGEVVERPASVIKELVENSLDAGATKIDVVLEGGGRSLLAVRDDGWGMTEEEARLAVQRHATSKIRVVQDLFRIGTLGFRGEALPSIASVSRFALTTRVPEALEGTRVRIEGGRTVDVAPAACPQGTEVEVRDLFYNTPARLKFLKSEQTERRNVSQAMTHLALANAEVRMKLTSEGKTVLDAPACDDLRERAAAVLGPEVAEHLYPVPEGIRRGELTIDGLFGAPHLTRKNRDSIYLFVNGRFVSDARLQRAVTVAYAGLLHDRAYPYVILDVDVPPEQVDVNVHPAKTEVRFHDPDLAFRVVRAALVEGLAGSPWVPKPKASRVYTLDRSRTGEGLGADPDGIGEAPTLDAGAALADTAQVPRFPAPSSFSLSPSGRIGMRGPEPVQQTIDGTGRLALTQELGGWWSGASSGVARDAGAGLGSSDGEAPPTGWFSSLAFVGRLGPVYLVLQDEAGMVVVDQHAAHERITFEGLKEVYAGHHREAQNLLLPVDLELDRGRRATLSEHLPFFATLGFEIEPFGADAWILRSVPAILARSSYQRLIADALDELSEHGHSERLDQAVDAVLSRMACHGSVRAGDRLEVEQVRALLRRMDAIDFRANCPHGRPVYFRMSWAELEKRFDRR